MRNKYAILHTPAGKSTPITDISDAIQMTETEGIRSTADTFSFNIIAKSKYLNFFNDGDRIKIYFSKGNDTPLLVIDGIIKEINYNLSIDQQILSISGQNILEILLNAPVPASYSKSGINNTSAKAIKNIVNQAAGLNKNAKYTFVTNIFAELKSNGGYIDDTSNVLSAFPIDYGRLHMPAFQLIEELSTWKWTGLDISKGTYIYYLDNNNNFHWEPRNNTVAGSIDIGNFLTSKISKSIFDVINYVIVNCGKDLNGNSINTWGYRPTYLVKGIKGKYFVNETLANNRRAGMDSTHAYGTYDKFTGSSDNSTFRNTVTTDGKAWAESILQVFGAPRFHATLTMNGTTAYYKGNLYTVNINGIFRDLSDNIATSLPLRLRDVTHSFTSKGWFTTLELLQDESTITGAGTV